MNKINRKEFLDSSILGFIKEQQNKNNFRNNIYKFTELLNSKKYYEIVGFIQSLDDESYKDAHGNTPIILCAKYNVPHKYITEILTLGFDINDSNYDNERAFSFVENIDDIKFYLDNNAEVNYFDKDKNHVIFKLLKKGFGLEVLVLLAKKIDYSKVYDKDNYTLLDIELSQSARIDFIKFYIKMGIDVKNISNKTNTLMKLMIFLSQKELQEKEFKEYENIFSLLLQKGADVNFIYQANEELHIPLLSYIASLNDSYIDFIKMMITHGCDFKALSSTNKTLFDYARAANNTKILRYLQKLDLPFMTKVLKKIFFKKAIKINYPLKIVELKNVFFSGSNKVSEELYKSVMTELQNIKFNIKYHYNEYDDFNLGEYEYYLQKARERNFPLMLQIMLDHSKIINNNSIFSSGRIFPDFNLKRKTFISIFFEENVDIRTEYYLSFSRLLEQEIKILKFIQECQSESMTPQAVIDSTRAQKDFSNALLNIIQFTVKEKFDLLSFFQHTAEFDTIREEFSLIENFTGIFPNLEPLHNLFEESSIRLSDSFWNRFKGKFIKFWNNFIGEEKDLFQLNYVLKQSDIEILKEVNIYILFQILKLEWRAFLSKNFITAKDEEIQSDSNFNEFELERLIALSDGQLNTNERYTVDILRSFDENGGEFLYKETELFIRVKNFRVKEKKIPAFTKWLMYRNAGIPIINMYDENKIKSLKSDNDIIIALLAVSEMFSKHVSFFCFGEQTNIDIINKYYEASH